MVTNLILCCSDLSFNNLTVPDNLFLGGQEFIFAELILSFNNVSRISRQTFSNLSRLSTLSMINNYLKFIPRDAFADLRSLTSLFLHGNSIKSIDLKAFRGLNKLSSLTLFDNPLTYIPDGIFTDMTSKTKVSVTCGNLYQLPAGNYTSVIECAPSAVFHLLRLDEQTFNLDSFARSGFVCHKCTPGIVIAWRCFNCSLCPVGYHAGNTSKQVNMFGSCQACPAGGFYQDQMGQINCKQCSLGTFVSKERRPGIRATDCWACPYGTLSNEHAGYRACKCLRGFYRLDRFGPCSECPAHGIKCDDDTAILAPNYFWKWANQSSKEFYKEFVDNIHSFGSGYNDSYTKFSVLLPKPVKCPFAGSCKGGINSECEEGYQGNLCATCSHGYYLRFNFCLKCPGFLVSIISSLVVIGVFILIFTMVLWGDSKKTENNRTVADIIMSCFKIVIGFYQVISGVFSALTRVHWPVTLIAMDKFLKLFDGNIFQFAPWSCVYSQLRLNPFLKFILVLSVTFLVVSFAFVYMFLQLLYIKSNKDRPESEKLRALSRLKSSSYRNIFLFLLASYPMTSKTIIQILPLQGACVKHCFSEEGSQCISLMKADYSIQCFTAQHNTYWPFAAVFSIYPVGFPLIVLLLIYKCRQSERYEELSFGLKVFFENYKDKFWFWEITEMYRKLILISLIFLFGSGGVSQIGLTLLVVSVFSVAYTFFRPIKGKFEDLLQTFVLWVIFFDVCLGAMYSTSDVTDDNDSLIVNILFVVLNSSVLLVALGKGIAHLSFVYKKVSSCVLHCIKMIHCGLAYIKRKIVSCFQTVFGQRPEPFDVQRHLLIQEFT